jgi:hypothetical protein
MFDLKISHMRLLKARPIYIHNYRLVQHTFLLLLEEAQTIVDMINSATDGDFNIIGAYSERGSQRLFGFRDAYVACAGQVSGR